MKNFSSLFIVALLSGATTLGAYKLFIDPDTAIINSKQNPRTTLADSSYNRPVGLSSSVLDFTEAAEKTVHSVVHVKNVTYRTVNDPVLEYFYGYKSEQRQTQVGTGSGVIISEDGYIVTNNHVIKDASDIEITLNNNKIYKAKLIGTDSKMDVALLKIDVNEKLPYSVFADSDQIRLGEWVLAVGNPYNLNSTVTAGIISAKARNLDNNSIQSFIQTDAAVNPGNSGGALVNTNGELIGINTMISSQTGSYVGYSFAVPSNMCRKIIEDIMEYGNVQRGILGVEGGELNLKASQELGISQSSGFYINKVNKNTGAEKAGLQKGDIITFIDNKKIESYADMARVINTKRPNDPVKVGYIRGNKQYAVSVILSKTEAMTAAFKGISLENLDATDKKRFNTSYGVKISDINNPNLAPYYDELKGNIILKVDNQKATDVETVSTILQNKAENQSIRLEMINKPGQILRIII